MDELSERFAAGEPAAIRDMYEEYARPVFAVAYRMLGDAGLAEEAVQQTFLKAWKAADRFDKSRDLAPWLYTIARRAAIDLYRRDQRHHTDSVEEEPTVLPPSFESTWAAWEVRRALDQLPEEERAVLMATHFLGLTQQEAAHRLGVPIGTIKSRSYRAYRHLARLLAHLKEASA